LERSRAWEKRRAIKKGEHKGLPLFSKRSLFHGGVRQRAGWGSYRDGKRGVSGDEKTLYFYMLRLGRRRG